MKKITKLVLGLIIFMMFFSSCAEEKKNTSNEQSAKTETAETSKSAEDGAIKFSTKDLDGNTVTESIFADYDLTLVNVWGTFCGPCKAELPELEEVYKIYKEKNCSVIALTVDVPLNDADALELAKMIWEDKGCSFRALQSVDAFTPIVSKLAGVPASFFVDKNGKIVEGSVHTGKMTKDQFINFFEDNLKKIR